MELDCGRVLTSMKLASGRVAAGAFPEELT
jgi:hypothetical protein